MRPPCAARTRGTAVRPVCLAALPALGGCVEQAVTSLGALAVLLALALCAGLAYALGSLRERHRSARALREARTALRNCEQLHAQWRWQTDAAHRLVSWRAPGKPAQGSCALFDPAKTDPALRGSLASAQAFAGVRLRCAEPLDGSRGWELRGVPRIDDSGAFAGFDGSATPTDEEDDQQLVAGALVPLLSANALPALLAERGAQGWRLRLLNAAGQALWPELEPGSALSLALASLPAALAAAAPQRGEPAECSVQGWRVLPVGPLPGGMAALVLAQLPEQSPTAGAATQEGDAFSFTLSHDLRAPIRVVEGFTRIVKEDYGRALDRVGNDHLDRVLGAAARMNLMIDALLALARLSQQPLSRQRVNLSQLAGYVVDELRRSAPERSAEIEIEAGLSAWGDPTLLRLVLENLLGNAWKYSARNVQTQISLRAVAQGATTSFVVRDNGAGFDMRSAERLFGLFQRLHSASEFPGHGVGLASVRRIVQRHGGEVWAEAEPGRGAAFHFTLPG